MKFLDKIQSLPLKKRKKIFWVLMVVIVVVLLFFYIKDVQTTLGQSKGTDWKETFKVKEVSEKVNQSKASFLKDFRKSINQIKNK